jgi:23S rRNA (uracil1939-C5)-methyltransferase/tRNA (uracil-5-)-methyltransferase
MRRVPAIGLAQSTAVNINDEFALHIEDLTNLGLGVGRKKLSDGSKLVVMVPLVLPGEDVVVRVTKKHSSYSEGELVRIVKPSSDRVTPLCPYFSTCGGCQYQHMNITAQREWKQSQVATALRRLASTEDFVVNDIVGTEHTYGYRSKLTPHYRKVKTTMVPVGKSQKHEVPKTLLGFLKRGTSELVDIQQCSIASDRINAHFESMRRRLEDNSGTDRHQSGRETTLLLRDTGGSIVTDPHGIVNSEVNGLTFQFKAGDFFQNNPHVLPLLVEHVVKKAAGAECEYLVDAYSGSGLFALVAARHFRSVYGVEISTDAVKSATANAQRNKIKNVQFLAGEAQQIFSQIQHLPRTKTVMIIDPPRTGCDKDFLTQLFDYHPHKLVYVSCDPATQARDTKLILAQGYKITDVTPFDMFPQTRHIENVITFLSTSSEV